MGLITFCALLLGSLLAPKMRTRLIQIDQLISQISSVSFTSLLLFTLFFILEQLALEISSINSNNRGSDTPSKISLVIRWKWPILCLLLSSMLSLNVSVIYKMYVVTQAAHTQGMPRWYLVSLVV